MAEKLTLDELGLRTRAANQRRAARQQERWRTAGRVALTIWVDTTTKARVDAARAGATLNETAERLMLAGLNATMPAATTTPAPEAATMDMFPAPATGNESSATKDALMVEVGKRLAEGFSGADVARHKWLYYHHLFLSFQRRGRGAAADKIRIQS